MKKFPFSKSVISGILAAATLLTTGCAQHHSLPAPDTVAHPFYGQPGENGTHFIHEQGPEHLFATSKECIAREDFAAPLNYRSDKPLTLNNSLISQHNGIQNAREFGTPLSPGDMLELVIDNGDGFNGRYVVDASGYIDIPLIQPIFAFGKNTWQVAKDIELEMIRAEIFQPSTALVNLQVLNWAGIEVSVSGAVFQPGRVLINQKHPNAVMDEKLAAHGDFSPTRLLSEAIRAASGIRPDAKLDQVVLIRKGWQVEVDLTGILTGQPVQDYPLVAGDQVIIPSTGCFQAHLVRPSQITPKGFRVFMSNLTDSAEDNASAGIGRYATNIPYGTRLLQAAISANCVGGKQWTNAPRKIVLASKHPITGETQVIERSVEQLMRFGNREAINPYLMPNDAVACYDSSVTNLRDIASAIVQITAPFRLL
ncbi:polysaccharide biosynthesis/export family protein [Planctobacterium marinum]|uniref:Polysaccharide biosynthesis protein n=1 Tax=Planctobacterium marinum TaxID=1631968 RepID=A0AA48KTJ7_9ALTE|nr:hypothetical protein MACH26_37730 [Planctobacterium marinum]